MANTNPPYLEVFVAWLGIPIAQFRKLYRALPNVTRRRGKPVHGWTTVA